MRKINLYIDGLFYRGSGIGRYYESLTKEFAKRGISIVTCVPERLKKDFEKDFAGVPNIEPMFVDYEKFSLKGLWKQFSILKDLENKVDLFFYPHINLPFYIPRNTIITIHDLRPFTEWWDRSELKREMYKILMKRAISKSKKIITISNAINEDLIKYYKNIKLESKINVIYEFIDDKFINFQKPREPLIKENYFLFVGNRKKNKNLKNLILAFNKIKDKVNFKLVVAGRRDAGVSKDEIDELIENLNLKNFIIEFLNPTDKDLINLYTYAQLFVFPSFYEGFGLPPLEAISCGCPAITSNIPVLEEILGKDIACFNPYSINDVAEKLLSVLKNDGKRQQLLQEGKERLKFFEKDKIINQYLKCFKETIKNKKLL
ncbi:MAG TPA: glycosyltransferase family 1 protein [Candidatus Pacearchaeota archaeon]|nr:glycosyltransferase family 1 protein [Candidatus Pacearchaeota archaeon]